MNVTIWTKSSCVQCDMTKKQMDKLGIKYEEQSLEDNPLVLEGFKAQGLLAAPIVTTDTKAWSGFRLDKIQSLDRYLRSHGEK
jgi:glutaredoxin-like protein NrdH